LGENGGKSKKDVLDYSGYPIWNNDGAEDYPTSLEYSISDYYNYTKYLISFPYLSAEDVLVKITKKDLGKNSGFLVTSAMTKEIELIEDTDFNYDLDIGVKQEVDSTEKMCPIIDTVPITNYCNMASRSKCEIDKNIYSNLVKAQEAAKSMGYILYVNNAHRLYSDQVFLFKKYGFPRAAMPSCNAPHVLGKAVDVVLIDANSGSPLPGMSSSDGKGSDAEKMSDMTVGDRTKLEKIMCDAGFVRYVGEFWHYEIGTKRWEEHNGKDCFG
jgi:D-alanyl-D-alanine dipeptidase